MSLIICKECTKEYSDKSNSCPNCGCPTSYNFDNEIDVNTETIEDVTELENKEQMNSNLTNARAITKEKTNSIPNIVKVYLIISIFILMGYIFKKTFIVPGIILFCNYFIYVKFLKRNLNYIIASQIIQSTHLIWVFARIIEWYILNNEFRSLKLSLLIEISLFIFGLIWLYIKPNLAAITYLLMFQILKIINVFIERISYIDFERMRIYVDFYPSFDSDEMNFIIITLLLRISAVVLLWLSAIDLLKETDNWKEILKSEVKNLLSLKLGIAILLFISTIELPYGYYQLLRLIVFASMGYFVYSEYKVVPRLVVYIYILIGLIFNPILPISLTKEIWIYINIISGFIMSIMGVLKPRKAKKFLHNI